jgi:hypothetical protein
LRGALRRAKRSTIMTNFLVRAALFATLIASLGCSSSNSTPAVSTVSDFAHVRFIEAAPILEALVNGVPTGLGNSEYLSVDGTTTSSQFPYGYLTAYAEFHAGTQSIEVLDELGYKVGPLKTDVLSAGKQYTIAIVGSYPNYKTIVFEDPAPSSSARLALYQAAPLTPSVDFGRFAASSQSNFVKLGSAAYASVVTVALGSKVTDFGGYAGRGNKPFAHGALTLEDVNSFDVRNVLPFNAAGRLSLFVLDPPSSANVPTVIGNLDP